MRKARVAEVTSHGRRTGRLHRAGAWSEARYASICFGWHPAHAAAPTKLGTTTAYFAVLRRPSAVSRLSEPNRRLCAATRLS